MRRLLAADRRRLGVEGAKSRWNPAKAREEACARLSDTWLAEWRCRREAIREERKVARTLRAEQLERMREHVAAYEFHPALAPHKQELIPEMCSESGPQTLMWQPATAEHLIEALGGAAPSSSWEARMCEWASAHAVLEPGDVRVSRESAAEKRARRCQEAGQCLCQGGATQYAETPWARVEFEPWWRSQRIAELPRRDRSNGGHGARAFGAGSRVRRAGSCTSASAF